MENKQLERIYKILEDWDNDDETLGRLEKAMEFWCSNWDIAEGMKHAIRLTLNDQYQNHESEQDPKDLAKLEDILDGAI